MIIVLTSKTYFSCNYSLNPYMTNGFSHYYHLGESTLIFRGFGCNFESLFHFSMKFLYASRIAADGTPRLRCHIWGYSVCLCLIKGTPGLNELKAANAVNLSQSPGGFHKVSRAHHPKCRLEFFTRPTFSLLMFYCFKGV